MEEYGGLIAVIGVILLIVVIRLIMAIVDRLSMSELDKLKKESAKLEKDIVRMNNDIKTIFMKYESSMRGRNYEDIGEGDTVLFVRDIVTHGSSYYDRGIIRETDNREWCKDILSGTTASYIEFDDHNNFHVLYSNSDDLVSKGRVVGLCNIRDYSSKAFVKKGEETNDELLIINTVKKLRAEIRKKEDAIVSIDKQIKKEINLEADRITDKVRKNLHSDVISVGKKWLT